MREHNISLPGLNLTNVDGSPLVNPTSVCGGNDCRCVNLPDDKVQSSVVEGEVRLLGLIPHRDGNDCRYGGSRLHMLPRMIFLNI